MMVTATRLYVEESPAPTWRWCAWCGHPTKYGTHFPNGDFDYDSVVVPRSEVTKYRQKAIMQGNERRSRATIRRNIALGYHSGSRG